MINRLETGVFGLPRRGVCPAERQCGAYPAPGGLNMSGISRVLPDRGATSAAPGGNQISSLICPKNTTYTPSNLHQIWNFL